MGWWWKPITEKRKNSSWNKKLKANSRLKEPTQWPSSRGMLRAPLGQKSSEHTFNDLCCHSQAHKIKLFLKLLTTLYNIIWAMMNMTIEITSDHLKTENHPTVLELYCIWINLWSDSFCLCYQCKPPYQNELGHRLHILCFLKLKWKWCYHMRIASNATILKLHMEWFCDSLSFSGILGYFHLKLSEFGDIRRTVK